MSDTTAIEPAPTSINPPPPYLPPTCDCSTTDIFYSHFPEFSPANPIYPAAVVQLFLDLGGVMVRQAVWCGMRQRGVELFTAHMLALRAYATGGGAIGGEGGSGGIPGLARGIITSKSVSKVSVGYDTQSTAMLNGGPWNYTTYGQEFLWWARLAGTGGFEVLSLSAGDVAGTVSTWARGVMLQWGS